MHAHARLTPEGRRILCDRIAGGRPVAHGAKEMGVRRTTSHRWWRRYRELGESGLCDRSWLTSRLTATMELSHHWIHPR